MIAAYEQYCTAFECWRTDQLEEFVKALDAADHPVGVRRVRAGDSIQRYLKTQGGWRESRLR